MAAETYGHIEGDFEGLEEGKLFRLDDGRAFQQLSPTYLYQYSFHPRVKIYHKGAALHMDVAGIHGAVEVCEVAVVEEGNIVSEFKGFEGDSVFVFDNGRVWQQAEYVYDYNYAHRPQAIVFDGPNGLQLKVEDMEQIVGVKRLR
jgi:hypothetical protein